MSIFSSRAINKKQLLYRCKIHQELCSKKQLTKKEIWDSNLGTECNTQVWTSYLYMKMCFHSKILDLSSTFKMNLPCLKLAVELNLIISISKTSVCNRKREEIFNFKYSEERCKSLLWKTTPKNGNYSGVRQIATGKETQKCSRELLGVTLCIFLVSKVWQEMRQAESLHSSEVPAPRTEGQIKTTH